MRAVRAILVIGVVALVALGGWMAARAEDSTATTTAPARVGDSFRAEHAKVLEHVTHWGTLVGSLPTLTPEEQLETMKHIVKCLNGNVRPHAEVEEKFFYPVVDRLAGTTESNPFTASLRYEHKVVGRWTDELTAEVAKPEPDMRVFTSRTQRLIGLLTAHFEQEEEVLLPIVEAGMTAEEFQSQVMAKMTE